jgi:hypothetical protein
MVADDVATKKKATYGFTADQFVDKLHSDTASAVSMAPSILKRMHEAERRKLLLELLPGSNYDLLDATFEAVADFEILRGAFSAAFRMAFDLSTERTRKDSLSLYLTILNGKGQAYRTSYEEAFFRALDLEHIESEDDKHQVKEHLFGRLRQEDFDKALLETCTGIGKYVTREDVYKGRARALWRPFRHCIGSPERLGVLQDWLAKECARMPSIVAMGFGADLERQIEHFEKHNRHPLAKAIKQLVDDLEISFDEPAS